MSYIRDRVCQHPLPMSSSTEHTLITRIRATPAVLRREWYGRLLELYGGGVHVGVVSKDIGLEPPERAHGSFALSIARKLQRSHPLLNPTRAADPLGKGTRIRRSNAHGIRGREGVLYTACPSQEDKFSGGGGRILYFPSV